jgi:hypothetical protein
VFHVAPKPAPWDVPLFRLVSAGGDDHLCCVSEEERNHAITSLAYRDKGILGYVRREPGVGTTPLYRAWNPVLTDHFYTTDVAEIDSNGPRKTSTELTTLLQQGLRDVATSDLAIYLADGSYFCPTAKVAGQIVERAAVDQQRYIAEVHDCDDFAHLLKSAFIMDAYDQGRPSLPYACGIVWGHEPAHAMNLVVLGDGRDFDIKLVEPQTGKFLDLDLERLRDIYLVVL